MLDMVLEFGDAKVITGNCVLKCKNVDIHNVEGYHGSYSARGD